MEQWPLKELASIYGVHIQNIEQQKQSVLKLETNRGTFALKHSRLEPEELYLQFHICRHLETKGFNRIASIVPTRLGDAFAQLNSERFMLTTWLETEQSNLVNPADLELAVLNLAQFHNAGAGYFGKVFWPKRRLYGVWPQRFSFRLGHILRYHRQILARGIRDEFDQLFVNIAGRALNQAGAAINRLKAGSYYRLANKARAMGTICHHDYAYHNILMDRNRRVWLVDFDYCILDMPLHDLGSMILRTVKLSNWSLDDAKRILLIYHEEKPLEPGELEVLLSFMEYPQDFWQLAWARYNEVGMHKYENLLLRLKKFVDTAEARDKFLARFARLCESKNFLPGRDIL